MLAHSGLRFGMGGGIGVHVFFTLSGFLITTLLLEEWSRSGGRVHLGHFWARRALRLLPGLLLMLMAVVTYAATLAPDAIARTANRAVPAVVLYVSNWVQALGGVDLGMLGHTWSLAVEEQFYLLWPPLLVVILARRGRSAAPLLVGTTLAMSALSLVLRITTWEGIEGAGRIFGTDTVADQLLAGALLAVVLFFGSAGFANRMARIVRWAWIPAAAWLLHMAYGLEVPDDSWITTAYATVGLTLAAASSVVLIAAVVTRPGDGLARALAWRPLVALGRISYGVYLWQLPMFFVVSIHMPEASLLTRAAIAMPASVVLAALSWMLVERRALRLKVMFAGARREPAPRLEGPAGLVQRPAS